MADHEAATKAADAQKAPAAAAVEDKAEGAAGEGSPGGKKRGPKKKERDAQVRPRCHGASACAAMPVCMGRNGGSASLVLVVHRPRAPVAWCCRQRRPTCKPVAWLSCLPSCLAELPAHMLG